MDADLDIYGRVMQSKSFLEFMDKVKDKSQLFITKDLPLTGVTVAVNEDAVYMLNVRIKWKLFTIKNTKRSLCRFAFWIT
jgi:UDP-N-acetylmuramate--alanine ligase